MIRISKLIRVAKSANKVPVRGGPGWDRPDVPPSQRVETDIRVIIPFIDSGLTMRSFILSSIHPCPNSSLQKHKSMKEPFTKPFPN